MSFETRFRQANQHASVETDSDTLGRDFVAESINFWIYIFMNPEIASISHDGNAARQVSSRPLIRFRFVFMTIRMPSIDEERS